MCAKVQFCYFVYIHSFPSHLGLAMYLLQHSPILQMRKLRQPIKEGARHLLIFGKLYFGAHRSTQDYQVKK